MGTTDPQKQLEVITLIARGDKYEDIAKNTGLAIATISKIKDRNQATLDLIKGEMIKHQISKAAKLRNKSLDIIETKLEKVAEADKSREDILQDAQDGKISWDEASVRLKSLVNASLADLNAISKEMFSQARIEQSGAPSRSPGQNAATTEQLRELVNSLEPGNEVELQRIIFKSGEE